MKLLSGILLLFCFVTHAQAVKTQTVTVKNTNEIRAMKLDFCRPLSLEILGLYPILNELPADEQGSQVKQILIKNGFVQTDGGRGNWEKGPRFTQSTWKKDSCTCIAIKKYYYNRKMADGAYDLRVTERLICNSDIFMDE